RDTDAMRGDARVVVAHPGGDLQSLRGAVCETSRDLLSCCREFRWGGMGGKTEPGARFSACPPRNRASRKYAEDACRRGEGTAPRSTFTTTSFRRGRGV